MKDEVPDDLSTEDRKWLRGLILLNAAQQLFWVPIAVVAVICYYAFATGAH